MYVCSMPVWAIGDWELSKRNTTYWYLLARNVGGTYDQCFKTNCVGVGYLWKNNAQTVVVFCYSMSEKKNSWEVNFQVGLDVSCNWSIPRKFLTYTWILDILISHWRRKKHCKNYSFFYRNGIQIYKIFDSILSLWD